MLSTPKTGNRLSYTRSLQPLQKSTSHGSQRVIHGSLTKYEIINYNTILNKLLAMQNYQKFMMLASKFVDREILQCKQQPNRLSISKGLQSHLICDGLFVRKLAELSSNPMSVVNHLMGHIAKNKKYLRDFKNNIKMPTLPGKEEGETLENDNNSCYSRNETEEEREMRLNGYHVGTEASHGKQNKILYSEYIKENRKSMEIYQKVLNRLEKDQQLRHSNHKSLQSSNKLKRTYRENSTKLHPKVVEPLELKNLANLGVVEQQLLRLFPSIKYIAHLSPQITVRKLIQSLGIYKGYEVKKVAIEVAEQFEKDINFVSRKGEEELPIIEHAILMEKITNHKQNETEKNVSSDNFVRIYLTD